MKIYSLFIKKFTAKCPITLGLKFRRKFFEEAKKRGSLVSGFRAQSPPPSGIHDDFTRSARVASPRSRRGEREKRRREKVSRPRSRRGSSMKRSLTVRVRYTMIKREFYETRNRETGPRPCRGCASRHPRNVDPGQGHFYLSFEQGTSLENQAIPYVLFDPTLNSNSFHTRSCVFFFPFIFIFFFLFVAMTVPPFLLLIYSIIERCFFSNFL